MAFSDGIKIRLKGAVMNIYLECKAFVIVIALIVFSGCTHEVTPKMENVPVVNRAAIKSNPELHMLSVGEYDIWTTQLFQPRKYCGTDPAQYAASVCGSRETHLWHVGIQEGNKCGYNYYVFTCNNP